MKRLHLDPFSGIAGDMMLGALVDVGAPVEKVVAALRGLEVGSAWSIEARRTVRGGIAATRVEVVVAGAPDHAHRDAGGGPGHPAFHGPPDHGGHGHISGRDLLARLEAASLPPAVRARAAAVFRRLVEAEAAVHGVAPDAVHLHEVGAADALLDVAGAAVALDLLGVAEVTTGPLPLGTGFVVCAHGRLPNPPPAVAALLAGLPTVRTDAAVELVTPTGAALVAALALPASGAPWAYDAVGYGAGSRDDLPHPNLLRVFLGPAASASAGADEVEVLECHVDDATPETIAFAIERSMAEGALDAAAAPLVMKKGRPGWRLTVLARPVDAPRLAEVILRETPTLGLRRRREARVVRPRETREVETPWGRVRAVVAPGVAAPEFEDCARIARERGLALREVYAAAVDALRRTS